MKEKKILITDGVHPILPDELKIAGFSIDYKPDISPDKTREMIGEYHGLIINSKIREDAPFLDHAPRIELIGSQGSGLEIIDERGTKKRNAAVFNSPDANCNALVEQPMGTIALRTKLSILSK